MWLSPALHSIVLFVVAAFTYISGCKKSQHFKQILALACHRISTLCLLLGRVLYAETWAMGYESSCSIDEQSRPST